MIGWLYGVFLSLRTGSIDSKGGAMEAAAKPLIQKYGWVCGVLLLLPIKLLVMPFNDRESVCPLKPDTAWMRCRSSHIKAGMGLRRVPPLLFKLFAMPSKEGVKPHQKLIAAGTLLRSRHGWLFGVFLMGLYFRPKNRRHKKSAPKCAFLACVAKSRLV